MSRRNPVAPILWALGLGLGMLSLSQVARAGRTDDLRRIRELAESNDPAVRNGICQEILNAPKPAPFAQFFCEGYEAVLTGREADVETALRGVLKDQPDFALAAVLYAETYERLHKPDQAEAYYRKAIEIQPDRADARFALGTLLLGRAQKEDPKYFSQALEAFRQATEQNPSSADGWSNLGLTLVRMGRLQDAEQMYKKAIDRDPSDPLLHDCLASVFAREDRTKEAEASWQEALRINPGYGPAVIELAALYARTDRLTEAIRLLETGRDGIRVPPWGPRIRRNLGFAYLGMSDVQSAKDRFKEAAASGNDASSFLGLGQVFMLEGDVPGALSALARGAELDSVMALPFVQAWQGALRGSPQMGAHPAVAAALHRLSKQGSGPKGAADPLRGASGRDATERLVGYVLGDWSFQGSAKTMEAIRVSSADTSRTAYDTPPIAVGKVEADYPESAQEEGLEGTVQVVVSIGENGKVLQTRIQECNAPPILCESALKAAGRWTFKPATRFGDPVRASMVLPFRFVKRN